MAIDILGNELYTGDAVVFSDMEEGEPTLVLYEVEELVDTNVVLATALSGAMIGSLFYLQDTNKRASFVPNVYKAVELKRKTTIH